MEAIGISVDYVVAKVDADTIFLKSYADISRTSPLNSKVSGDISGVLSGEFKIDRLTGMLLDGLISITANADADSGTSIKTSFKSTQSIRRSPIFNGLKAF